MWLDLIAALTSSPAPLLVAETHAGAGVYDLLGPQAQRSGEAQAGVGRLMAADDAPASLAALKHAVQRLNGEGEARLYPGSPILAAGALRAVDRYVGCELRPDDHAALAQALRRRPPVRGAAAEARLADGYAAVPPLAGARRLVMIDPPFERGDEAARLVETTRALLTRNQTTAVAVWAPIKDLDGFDRLLGGLETLRPARGLCIQVRLRPLHDPMRMNGCAMILLDAPEIGGFDLDARAVAAAEWVVRQAGEAGGRVRRHAFGRDL